MISLSPSWLNELEPEFSKPYFQNLKSFLVDEINAKKIIYPHPKDLFNAFAATALEDTKVVILGQDPYHGENQAHGLSFSVPENQSKIPPSLKNIFKEIEDEFGTESPQNGNLMRWANQGVFLLNTTLTVEAHKAGSHQKRGWEEFTDTVIQTISDKKEHVVFLLWGKFAEEKIKLINTKKHLVLASPHPSPLSSYRGFFGNMHFAQCNEYLEENGIEPIEW